ncbi:N-6 DNA methylase [Streptococcus dysgalactiae subsp. equisimilis]|uniref:N-6 DNA methylase n=1 Tax=Streptococcus dysgalactiae TaxID=1334 RepID=UPI0010CAC63C|nr:N-6 DNA methylase [Streptococcus dysgalactiae]QET82848.1 N-6 DNA methylase [Streptococcus dysgalactiae]GET83696.1 phage associated protein [Streptococcus dysgalactiae subsp. equisimilis]VTT15677.1 Type I restriction-modification system methyltransferase subunit [Streptococcus dysgalactiae subsp. equisimilis]
MVFKEHNNRNIANKFAEYITSPVLRQYLADKVKQYCGNDVTVFDGAAGSGQLEQFINPKKLYAVEIQEMACETLKENYPNADISCQSFFTYDSDIQVDAIAMNPPYSLKFKELPEEDRTAIQEFCSWKKSGVVDDIFMLKAMKYTKRYGFFIMFPGITYRASEKNMRELIGNQLVELNEIQNGFEDTQINVVFIVLDKQKTSNKYSGEIYDAKTKRILWQEENTIDDDKWQIPRIEVEKEEINIDEVNEQLDKLVIDRLENHLASQLMVIQSFHADIDYIGFIEKCRDLLYQYELYYNFGVERGTK